MKCMDLPAKAPESCKGLAFWGIRGYNLQRQDDGPSGPVSTKRGYFMERLYKEEGKAKILIDSLPYIRDFNQKIIVVCFSANNLMSDAQVQSVMQDIALLKSIGMKPILVHDSKMGYDKFRENKRLAKLIEFCGIKAVGICGIDLQTINMTLNNDYIPVITPNDIDTEDQIISPEEAAYQVALLVNAEKVIYMGADDGIHDSATGEIISQMTFPEVLAMKDADAFTGKMLTKVNFGLDLIDKGIPRVHFLGVAHEHAILIEIFSIVGIGTVIMQDRDHYYPHEMKNRPEILKD